MRPRRLSIPLADGTVSALAWGGHGGARPPIHFAHANGFNAETYDSLLSPLAGDRPVFASDFRGHGLSALPASPPAMKTWRIYVDDLAQVLERLPGGGPFVLGGHSMGATTSLLLAAARPDLVRGLVLAEPVIVSARVKFLAQAAKALGFYDRIMPMAAQARRRRTEWPDLDAAFAAYRGRGAFRSWPERMLRDYLSGGLLPAEHGQGTRLACAPEWEAANYRAGPPSVWGALSRIHVPVVLLTGGRRSTCSEAVARALQSRVKSLKWMHFPECSHFLPMEEPQAVADSLQAMAN